MHPEALRDFHHGMVAMQLDMLQHHRYSGSVEERRRRQARCARRAAKR
jgi:hypothetical protein